MYSSTSRIGSWDIDLRLIKKILFVNWESILIESFFPISMLELIDNYKFFPSLLYLVLLIDYSK